MYSNGFLSERLSWAIAWREATHRRRPDLALSVLDAAYDNLVDLLLARDDLGMSRAAVFALGNKQLGWRICSAIRVRRLPSGERRSGPANAVSLEALTGPGADASRRLEAPAQADVATVALHRVAFDEVISAAQAGDRKTAAIVLGYIIGLGPEELAAQTGLKANTVAQRKVRFERTHREKVA